MSETYRSNSNLLHPSIRNNSAILGSIVVFLVVNLTIPTVTNFGMGGRETVITTSIAASAMGFVIGQLNLIGVWAALAAGRLVVRIPWSFCLLVLVYYSLLAGSRWTSYFNADDASQLASSLVVGFFAVQIPLWLASKLFHWRLANQSSDSNNDVGHYSILELMIATGVLGILLGLGRMLLPEYSLSFGFEDSTLLVVIMAVIFTNLIVVVPCVWLAFRDSESFYKTVRLQALLAVGVTVLEFGTLCALLGPPGPNVLTVFIAFVLMNLTQCATVLVVMRILYSQGYRLSRVRNEPALTPQGSELIDAVEESDFTASNFDDLE